MRRVGFGLGIGLAVFAAATLVAQLFSYLAQGGYVPVSLAAIWDAIHADSLAGLRGLVEQRLAPALWPPLAWLLGLPAWLVLGVAAGLLLLACRPRRRGYELGGRLR